jgi:hypothetical protein
VPWEVVLTHLPWSNTLQGLQQQREEQQLQQQEKGEATTMGWQQRLQRQLQQAMVGHW